jgi:hypothetical protein
LLITFEETGYSMNKAQTKILSIALIVLGVGLAFWGYQMSGSFGSQVNQAVTGSFTDKTMMALIAGVISFIVGLVLLVKK